MHGSTLPLLGGLVKALRVCGCAVLVGASRFPKGAWRPEPDSGVIHRSAVTTHRDGGRVGLPAVSTGGA